MVMTQTRATRLISGLFILVSVVLWSDFCRANDSPVSMVIEHSPFPYFISDHRIQVKAAVSDPAGVSIVRCYFREKGQADYVFIDMLPQDHHNYSGTLPAPAPETRAIEYSILAVNNVQSIYKTQMFVVDRQEGDMSAQPLPSWQQVPSDSPVLLKTELTEPPLTVPGFRDNVTIDVIESTLRFAGTGTIIVANTGSTSPVSSYWLKEFVSGSGKKVWYKQWWVWTGVAVVAGGTAVALSHDGGSDDTATVTVAW